MEQKRLELSMIKFFKNYLSIISFSVILVISILLRFYQLGINPPSLDWDEVSLGYNAYSILKTGADEYGNKFPLSFRSFDDYKPPLYVYLTVVPIVLFGLGEFAVRFPSAVLGILTVAVTYFLVKELLKDWNKSQKETIALLSMFFVAISPWSLQFSRAAFEGNMGLFFFTFGILLFLKGIINKKVLIISSISFALSLYSYHSFRLIVPIFIFLAFMLFIKELIKEKFYPSIFCFLILTSTLPIILSLTTNKGAGSRLSMVTLFDGSDLLNHSIKELEYDQSKNDYLGYIFHNRRVAYGQAIVKGYLDHWNPDFLFLHGDGGRQHHAVNVGMLYLWDICFILLGIYLLLNKFSKRILILFIWFIIAPLASSITTGTPHPVRAIGMLIPFHILAAAGLFFFCSKIILLVKNKILSYTIISFAIIGLIFNIIYYLHQYYIHTPIEYGDFWQYGNKEVILEAKNLENKYSKIIMSYKYDQPYVYYLFYGRIDPFWYQKNWDYKDDGTFDRFKRVIGKYEFRYIDYEKDKNIPHALLIGSPSEIPDNAKTLKLIYFPNGDIAYKIAET